MAAPYSQSPDTLPSLVFHQYSRQEGVLFVDAQEASMPCDRERSLIHLLPSQGILSFGYFLSKK